MSNRWLTTEPVDLRRDRHSVSARVARRDGAVKPAIDRAFARLAKGVAPTIAVIASVFAVPLRAVADETSVAFIRDLGNQSLAVLRSAVPLASKADYFERMIHQDFDLTGISQFELGPYWRIASPVERQEFLDLFADHLIRFYG